MSKRGKSIETECRFVAAGARERRELGVTDNGMEFLWGMMKMFWHYTAVIKSGDKQSCDDTKDH